MARESMHGMEMRMGQAVVPLQHFGTMFLENMERVADYQFEMMQSYTHLAVGQMRDALEIHDPQSFGEYLRKQNDRVREFGEKLSGDSRRLIQMGQESGREALRTAEQSARNVTQLAERGAEQAQRMSERGAEQMQRAGEQAQRGEQKQSKLPINNYDDMTAADIEQRAEKLDQNQIRQLLDHERSTKNRKTLIEAFERRL